jgi:hypothetical protein
VKSSDLFSADRRATKDEPHAGAGWGRRNDLKDS